MNRKIKKQVLAILAEENLHSIRQKLSEYGEHGLVNPLFSALYRPEEVLRWHAVSLFGDVLGRLAEKDMEAARIVMRRFLWSLNDESGGIGWGAPEAMAEAMAHNEHLCDEYLHMLISYMRPDGPLEHQDGNFLELPALQSGLLWGIGRLAENHSELLHEKAVVPDLKSYLSSEDASVRGMAVRALRLLSVEGDEIDTLLADESPVRLYRDGEFSDVTVSYLAEPVLATA